jgi:cell division protein FtsW
MFSSISKYLKGDKVVWTIMLILALFSILTVYSATGTLAYKMQHGNTSHYVFKHVITLLMGFTLTFLIHNVNYNMFYKSAKLMLIITIPLLLLTLIMGVSLNSAARWITIPGLGLTFQSSDFAKFSLILYVAYWLSKNQENIEDFKKVFLPIVSVVGIICVLVLPANFSTAALLFIVSVVMMFVGRISFKHLGLLFGICVLAISLIVVLIFYAPNVLPRGKTWKTRIESFAGKGEEGSNFQADQSKIAIATGGIMGKGPGNSVQRNFLPHPYSDFIYAIIVEEYGFVGGAIVLFLFLVFLYRAYILAKNSDYKFAVLVAIGLSFSMVFQAMINMAVAVNLIPVTGQTLPMVSMGGSSILFTSISFGLFLSVSRCTEQIKVEGKKKASKGEKTEKVETEKEIVKDIESENPFKDF